MNILFLIFSFTVGGAERLIVDLIKQMCAEGHHVHLCVINHHYDAALLQQLPPEASVCLLERPVGGGHQLSCMRKIRQYVTDHRIQVIHCHGIHCVTMALPALHAHPETILFQTVHAAGEATAYSFWQKLLLKKKAAQVIAISGTVRDELLQSGISEQKITVIPNAIDMNRFPYHARRKTGLSPEDAITVGCVGRIHPVEKGQDILIKAVAQVRQDYPHLRCILAGGTVNEEQEKELTVLRQYVREHDLADVIEFAGNVDDIPAFLSAIDLFVLPSRIEGFGMALTEAMASGVPCICAALPGPEEIISSPELGLTFTPGDPAHLAEQIRYMISHYDQYDTKAISDHVRARYGIDQAAERHLTLYRQYLS